jgi:drug/metabolite transporter (DMT)-like permease
VASSALALALAAAVVHALWNVLLARARDIEAATAGALVVAVVVFALPAGLSWHVEWGVWPFAIASAALELTYFSLLAAAYRRAEFSVVYPIARGSAPVLVLAVAVAALGVSTSWEQAVGVGLVACGIVLVRGLSGGTRVGGAAFGLVIGAVIAAYTLVDKAGLRHAAPVSYLELTMVPATTAYFAAALARNGFGALRTELNVSTIVAGIATFGAYALVLAALKLAPAAPVAAVRETSVIIAAAFAHVFLKERVGWKRAAGAAAVVAGVGLLGLA